MVCGIGHYNYFISWIWYWRIWYRYFSKCDRECKKYLQKSFNFDLNNFFQVYNGKEIFFDDEYFNFIVSDCVLDSMPFELAKKIG